MCKSCISFTRRVPVEVMQLIFCMCLPQTDYITPDPTSAPLLLSQISHSWRRLALATPQLWCSLSVCISRRRGFWKSFLESWLGRSGDIPISLQISRKPQCVSYSNEYFNEHIIKLLVKDSKRWRRLSLDTPAVSMTRLLNYSMPMLEILELGNNCDKPSGLLLSSVDVPRLHTVCLLSSTVDLIPPLLFAPLERLVQFQAPNYILDLPNCFTVLGKCVRLERCTIQLSLATVDASQLDLPALRMPRLHTFAVLGDAGQGGAVCSLLENITLPALERLELSAHTWYNKREFYLGPDSPIISLARQSRCALRTLHLKGGAFVMMVCQSQYLTSSWRP
ncbi:hypothetical protein C8J57DRAFT_578226 [Mycena rebaudengoi]|nr:hypothetical protein C8J57DRAFT_578226 [Mycena rebaudengoi]